MNQSTQKACVPVFVDKVADAGFELVRAVDGHFRVGGLCALKSDNTYLILVLLWRFKGVLALEEWSWIPFQDERKVHFNAGSPVVFCTVYTKF